MFRIDKIERKQRETDTFFAIEFSFTRTPDHDAWEYEPIHVALDGIVSELGGESKGIGHYRVYEFFDHSNPIARAAMDYIEKLPREATTIDEATFLAHNLWSAWASLSEWWV